MRQRRRTPRAKPRMLDSVRRSHRDRIIRGHIVSASRSSSTPSSPCPPPCTIERILLVKSPSPKRTRAKSGATGPTTGERIALVLAGGNALGAFEAGAYQALHDAGLRPDWVVGTSI